MNKKHPQILFVTGKGGVGKTSISIMLGLAQAKRGIKTLIVQTYGAKRVSSYFDRPPATYTPQNIHPNLFTMSITAQDAIEEYALQQLKFRKLYKLVFENRFAKPLIQGAPGLHDAVHLGKIYDLAEREKWPSIIVDAPATGHALSMLRSAKTMMDLTKAGPMYQSNAIVDSVFTDMHRTQLVLVSLLEELPVQETCELWNTFQPNEQQQCVQLIHNKVISPPPSCSLNLPPMWKDRISHLQQKRTDQQQFAQQLEAIPITQTAISQHTSFSIPEWTNSGAKIWGRI